MITLSLAMGYQTLDRLKALSSYLIFSSQLNRTVLRTALNFSALIIWVLSICQSQVLLSQDLYYEDFNLPSGTTVDNGPTAWTRDISNANLGTGGFFETRSFFGFIYFQASDIDGEAVWISQEIDISGESSVQVSVEIAEFGTMEGNDYLRLYYVLDGGSETIFGDFRNDFGFATQLVVSPNITGTTLQVIARVSNNNTSESHIFDNVRVFGSTGGPTLYSRSSRNWNHFLAWSEDRVGGPPCFCTPDSNTNVVIGGNHLITLNIEGNARGLLIQDNGSLSFTGSNNLNLTGNMVNTSSNPDPIIVATQAVVLNGSTEQTLALNDESLFDLTVDKPSGQVLLTQPMKLQGTLSLLSATELASQGNLTLISTSDGNSANASVATIPGGASITGDVTVQRYISAEGNIWRYISSPVTNATIADWQDDFPVTGNFTDPSTGAGIDADEPSIYVYGESLSGSNKQLGWIAYPSSGMAASNPIVPGAGYSALMLDGGNATNVDVTGPLNQGDFNFNVSFAGSGWNLLGNPYPATVDWGNTVGWSRSNVANAVYIRNNENGNTNSTVASFVDGVGTNGGTGLIATGQSFWVLATGSNPSLTLNERAKSATTGAFFKLNVPRNLFRITLKDETNSDETVIRFRNLATNDFDVDMDAKKLSNGTINLSTQIDDGDEMAINSFPELFCFQELDLNLSNTPPGSYQLQFTELSMMQSSYRIHLEDLYQDSTIQVKDSTTYSFTVDETSESFHKRFNLKLDPGEIQLDLKEVQMTQCNGNLELRIPETREGIVYSLVMEGELLVTADGNSGELTLTSDLLPDLTKKQLSLRLTSKHCSNIIYEEQVFLTPPPEIQEVESQPVFSAGQVTLKATSSVNSNGIRYNWYDQPEDSFPVAVTRTGQYTTPRLVASATYYVSVTSESGCESDRLEVLAEIIDPEEMIITPSPIPFRNVLTLRLNAVLENDLQVWVYNQIGKLEFNTNLTVQRNSEATVDLSRLAPGVYFISVSCLGRPHPMKIIKVAN